jgi:ABC-2 type transport system ATP-binding protein
LLQADKGKVKILGFDVPEQIDMIKSKINLVFARGGVYWNLTLKENLELFGKIHRIKNLEEKIEELIEIFELGERAEVYADRCSTGELMRLKLARALLNDPKILFLDEPTIGLDPAIALKVREFIKKLNKKKKTTILLTTHYMQEADMLCKRVAIIHKGRIIAIDTPTKLKRKLKRESIIEMDVRGLTGNVIKKVKNLEGVKGLAYIEEWGELRIILKKLETLDKVINVLKTNKVKFYSIHVEEPTLEDVFLYLTGRRLE